MSKSPWSKLLLRKLRIKSRLYYLVLNCPTNIHNPAANQILLELHSKQDVFFEDLRTLNPQNELNTADMNWTTLSQKNLADLLFWRALAKSFDGPRLWEF